jgi:hypothetical protein
MAKFDVVDLTKGSIVTRGGEYGDRSIVGSIDTADLARQLDTLRTDLSTVLDASERGIGLNSIVVKLTVGAEGRVAFIAKGSVEASIEVTFSSANQR